MPHRRSEDSNRVLLRLLYFFPKDAPPTRSAALSEVLPPDDLNLHPLTKTLANENSDKLTRIRFRDF